MEYVLPLLTLAAANLLAAMSPGPAFILVVRSSVTGSRRVGLASAAGVILGAVVWAIAALFGLALLFSEIAWLYRAVQAVGGLYLIYVAVMVWRGARAPVEIDTARPAAQDPWRAFAAALTLQLSTPKAIVFFSSVFVALLPAHAPAWVWIATLAIVAFNETVWYLTLVFSFSARPVREAYGRLKLGLDRTVAAVLGGLGLKLVLDSR